MYKYYISIIFLFFAYIGFSQQKEIDSLKQALKTKQHDTIRVNQLNRLGFLYRDTKPDTTLKLAQEAVALAQDKGFIRGEARALNVLGIPFYTTGNYPKALEYFLKSLKKYEDLEDLEGIANATNNIGNIHSAMGNNDQGLSYYFKTLKIDETTGNKNGIAHSLSNIGALYSNKKEWDSARTYTLDAYNIGLKEKNNYIVRLTSGNLGGIYYEMDQPGIASEYYKTVLASKKNDVVVSQSALGIARIFKDKKLRDSTLYYAKYSYDIAKNGNFTDSVLESSTFLAEYYKENNNIDSAFAYQNISLAAKDSLYDQEKRNKVQALALEETARQQEIENALLEVEKNNKLNLQYLGITAGIVGFILVFFLLSRSIIIGEKWLGFLGIFILLLVFEFTNLFLAPKISEATNYSPIWTLLIMVGIAAMLVPLHHKIEKYITKKMVKKNKEIKIAAARKTLERLEMEK